MHPLPFREERKPMNTRKLITVIPLWGMLLILPNARAGDIYSLERPHSPVILRGEELPGLLGAPVEQIRVYRYRSGTGVWEPVPFQIDERDEEGRSFFGAKNGLLDAVDEIAFLARDLGDRAPVSAWVDDPSSRNAARVEVRATDPLGGGDGWLYLYLSGALPKSPDTYIRYDTESDIVQTAVFRIAHGANGFQDEIILLPESGGDGLDFLDRQKFRLKVLIRELGINKEVTLKEEMNEDIALLPGVPARVRVQLKGVRVNTDPVIRLHRELELNGSFRFSFLGMEFDEDTSFSFPMVYYPDYMELRTGDIELKRQDSFEVTEFRISTDLNQDSRGMLYYNQNGPEAFIIDGFPDTPDGAVAWPGVNWFMATANPQDSETRIKRASLVTVLRLSGDPFGNPRLYYKDWYPIDPGDTGDQRSFGDAGLRVSGSRLEGRVDASMASYYLPQNLSWTDAETLSRRHNTPLILAHETQRVFALAVLIDPPEAGIVLQDPEGALIVPGTEVALNALAHPGYVFTHWGEDLTGNENPETLIMDGNKAVIAYFERRVSVTIRTDQTGATFTVDGIRYANRKTFDWKPGDIHAVAADSVQSVYTGVRTLFDFWSNGADRAFEYRVPETDETVTGSFTLQYLLTARPDPGTGGEVRVTPESDGWFDAGTEVGLHAIPAIGHVFTGWTGALTGRENPARLRMNSQARVTALFDVLPPVVAQADTFFAEDDTLTLTHRSLWNWTEDAVYPDSTLQFVLKEGRHIGVRTDSALGVFSLFSKIMHWNGIDTLVLEATNPPGETGSGKLVVTVLAVPDPPGPFTLIAPEDGAVFTEWPHTLLFKWEESVDPDQGDTVSYVFELDGTETFDSEFLIRQTGLPGTELILPWPDTHGDRQYFWRVRAVDRDSLTTLCTEKYRTLTLATPVAGDPGLPVSFTLDQNYPNPFNSETVIRYGLPTKSHVRISVYNSHGRHVATLVDAEKPAGYHTIRWQARDESGQAVSSGLYFIRFNTEKISEVKKTIYLR